MFFECSSFNQPLNNWRTLAVQSMTSMFNNATAFNQNINTTTVGAITYWSLISVTSLDNMFNTATAFNNGGGNLDGWIAPNCATYASMFSGATAFNQSIANLVDTQTYFTSPTLTNMFYNATLFNQDLSNWKLNRVTNLSGTFSGATTAQTSFNNGDAAGASPPSPHRQSCRQRSLPRARSASSSRPRPYP